MSKPFEPSNSDPESQIEAFRQVTAATTRAIAADEELDVQFGPVQAAVVGSTVNLPTPPRDMAYEEVARIRGEADAIALRRRYHDANLHRARAPSDEGAAAVVRCLRAGSLRGSRHPAYGRGINESRSRLGRALPLPWLCGDCTRRTRAAPRRAQNIGPGSFDRTVAAALGVADGRFMATHAGAENCAGAN